MKKWLLLVLLLVGISIGFGVFLYNKPHRNIRKAGAEVAISAESLFNTYSQDEAKANKLYLNKVVQVKGKVREIIKSTNESSVILESGDEMGGIACTLEIDEKDSIPEGRVITLKGLCVGMLTDVVLIKCSVVDEETSQ